MWILSRIAKSSDEKAACLHAALDRISGGGLGTMGSRDKQAPSFLSPLSVSSLHRHPTPRRPSHVFWSPGADGSGQFQSSSDSVSAALVTVDCVPCSKHFLLLPFLILPSPGFPPTSLLLGLLLSHLILSPGLS